MILIPNWCECDLKIKAPKNVDLQEIISNISGDCEHYGGTKTYGVRFQKIHPCPLELMNVSSKDTPERKKELKDKYGWDGWYDWHLYEWGTKWDADLYSTWSAINKDNSVEINFGTAWSPPTPVFEKLSSMYPKLGITLKYYEGGMGFSGMRYWKEGQLIRSSENNNYRGGRGG